MVKNNSCTYCGRRETKAITINDDRMCNACEYIHKHDVKGARKIHAENRARLKKQYEDSLKKNDGQ